jgi:hypothetical protein
MGNSKDLMSQKYYNQTLKSLSMYKGWIAPKRQGTHGGRMMGGVGSDSSEWVGDALCFRV